MEELPCNIMVCDTLARHVLPGLRAEMVCRLVSDYGVSQSEIARRLGVSRAAVSQYMNKKRGELRIDLSGEVDEIINLWAYAVMNDDVTVTLCDICRCAMHAETYRN